MSNIPAPFTAFPAIFAALLIRPLFEFAAKASPLLKPFFAKSWAILLPFSKARDHC